MTKKERMALYFLLTTNSAFVKSLTTTRYANPAAFAADLIAKLNYKTNNNFTAGDLPNIANLYVMDTGTGTQLVTDSALIQRAVFITADGYDGGLCPGDGEDAEIFDAISSY